MFKETEEGQTHYCEACEAEARGGVTIFSHTCGKPPKPSETETIDDNMPNNKPPKPSKAEAVKSECCISCKYTHDNGDKCDCICHDTTCPIPTRSEEWEKRFDEKFDPEPKKQWLDIGYEELTDFYEDLKSFIRELLSSERQLAKEEVRKEDIVLLGILIEKLGGKTEISISEMMKKYVVERRENHKTGGVLLESKSEE